MTEKKGEQLTKENARLRKIIGDLTVELKKRRVAAMRRESARTVERNLSVVDRIKEIKVEHPFWGYRRTWAYLKYIDGLEINKKRVLRLMQRHNLLVKPDTKLTASRTSGRSKPRPERPNQWWGIDMTNVMVHGFGWMYITVVLDWYTKKIVPLFTGGATLRVQA